MWIAKYLCPFAPLACVRYVMLACPVELSYVLKLFQCLKLHCIHNEGAQELAWYTAVTVVVRMKQLQQSCVMVDCFRNVMAHAQKPDFVFRQNGQVCLNQRGHQFSRLLAAEACAPAVVMLDTPCSEVVWRVLATHSIRQFPLHFPSRASPCAITFQLDSTWINPA